MKWRAVAFCAVLAALAVSYGIFTSEPAGVERTASRPEQPGYYLEDAVIVETNPNGKPRMQLAAQRIEQHPSDESISLTDVKVDYLAVPEKHWVLTADRGTMPPKTEVVNFVGDVTLRQVEPLTGAVMRTAELSVDTKNDIATSTSPVAIEMQGHSILAQGLTANLKADRVRLESNVHGRFQR